MLRVTPFLWFDDEAEEAMNHYVSIWDKLSAGGQKGKCGWLKDKFGLSWQVILTALSRLMSDPDPKKSKAVVEAMLRMDKIDIGSLQLAHDS